MSKLILARTSEDVSLKCSWLTLSLLFIFICTLFNGFFDTIDVECGYTDFWQCTTLGEPVDLHADLIKSALSLASSQPPSLWDWSSHYQAFYLHSAYGKMEDVATGRVTVFGVPPFTLLLLTGTLQGILATGPVIMVSLYYTTSLILLGALCWCLVADLPTRLLAFVVLAFSYPFMLMLMRGNIGALITGGMLISYIYLACNKRHLVLACVCLAIACNIRPNTVILAPLLLCFGMRRAIWGSAFFLGLAGSIAVISYLSVTHLYPGYSFNIFLKALETYERLYVIGPFGNSNNNSAFGAVKLFCGMCLMNIRVDELRNYNTIILCLSAVMIGYATYRFWRGQLPAYHFAFVLTCLYILASAVFATYHLLVLYVFILAAGSKTVETGPFPVLLLFMATLVIVPKNYFYPFPNLSFEVILNPAILLICVIWVLWLRFPVPDAGQVIGENSRTTPGRKRRQQARV